MKGIGSSLASLLVVASLALGGCGVDATTESSIDSAPAPAASDESEGAQGTRQQASALATEPSGEAPRGMVFAPAQEADTQPPDRPPPFPWLQHPAPGKSISGADEDGTAGTTTPATPATNTGSGHR